ncbi:MAG: CPBP family intramembrane glutamic endopeptidase [Pseudomonadota bacterium]
MSESSLKTRRRLQRDKDFTGDRLTTFRQVFWRHGLPGLALALLCFATPDLRALFVAVSEKAMMSPAQYALIGLVIFALLSAYAWRIDRRWDPAKLGWIIYLGALSFWEEWVFRVALPYIMYSQGIALWIAIVISALVFSAAHYFTLRWKWHWCVGTFFGSLALSALLEAHHDLFLITAFHWIGTYSNTPRPPGQNASVGLRG